MQRVSVGPMVYESSGLSWSERSKRFLFLCIIVTAVIAPTILLLSSLVAPFVPLLEPLYFAIHKTHSIAWYERNPTARHAAIMHCGIITLRCINAMGAASEVHDPYVRRIQVQADKYWEP